MCLVKGGKWRINRLDNGKWVPSNKNSWQWHVISKMDLKWMMLVLLDCADENSCRNGIIWSKVLWHHNILWHQLTTNKLQSSVIRSWFLLASNLATRARRDFRPLVVLWSSTTRNSRVCSTQMIQFDAITGTGLKSMVNIGFHISFCFQPKPRLTPKPQVAINLDTDFDFVCFISRGLGTLLWTFLLIFILMYVGAIVGMESRPFVLACFCVLFPCFFLVDPLVERVNLGKKDE